MDPEDIRHTMRTEMMKQAVIQQEVDRRVYLTSQPLMLKKYFDKHPSSLASLRA